MKLFSSLQQSGMKRMKNRRNKFLILMLFAAARVMRYFRLRRMNNSRISAVKVRHRDTIYGQAKIRGVRERSRRIGGMHVTFKRYCRAVSPRRRPSFPKSSRDNDGNDGEGLPPRTFSGASPERVRNYAVYIYPSPIASLHLR